MNISIELKKRFCKECRIPIGVYIEPIFHQRLELYDTYYNTIDKWITFIDGLRGFKNEQDYFEHYNYVKEEAIQQIKSSTAYKNFNEENMDQFKITHQHLPKIDIFEPHNDKRTFISIDMKKANFSALRYYDKKFKSNESMFLNADTWEDFISNFTSNLHLINSKYVRQVILGNCNSRRHTTYEKYIMDNIITALKKDVNEKIVFFSNDEIIFDVTELDVETRIKRHAFISEKLVNSPIPFRVELFTVHKIEGTNGYYKEIYDIAKPKQPQIEFKCLDSYILPFVIRKFKNEETNPDSENDKIFYQNGLLSKFLETPTIII